MAAVTANGIAVTLRKERHDQPTRRISRHWSQDVVVGSAHQTGRHHIGHGGWSVVVTHSSSVLVDRKIRRRNSRLIAVVHLTWYEHQPPGVSPSVAGVGCNRENDPAN